MNKRLLATVVAAVLIVSLVGCQNKPVGPVTPFQPAAIDPQAFSKKVDTFVIVWMRPKPWATCTTGGARSTWPRTSSRT